MFATVGVSVVFLYASATRCTEADKRRIGVDRSRKLREANAVFSGDEELVHDFAAMNADDSGSENLGPCLSW